MGWRFPMVLQIKKKTTTSETKINHIIATINCNCNRPASYFQRVKLIVKVARLGLKLP